jgi:hypothetical protein
MKIKPNRGQQFGFHSILKQAMMAYFHILSKSFVIILLFGVLNKPIIHPATSQNQHLIKRRQETKKLYKNTSQIIFDDVETIRMVSWPVNSY